MNTQRGYTTLVIMFVLAVVFVIVGFLIIRQRINTNPPSPTAQQNSSNLNSNQTPLPDQTQTNNLTAGWQVYANSKYGYSLQYPPNLKVGSISGNSVLGDAQNPIKGYHVGPLVLISLKGNLRKTGADYFNESYNLALNPPAQIPGGPAVVCNIDKINNPNIAVKSVSCTGEGGPARYALIIGSDYDVFVDGYSQGFDNADNGSFKSDTDYNNILGTFSFVAPTVTPMANTPAPPQPTLQTFVIVADDVGANPSQINVPKGTIVEITFNVSSSNVYHGGLDFRSSVINSGTIYSGSSKSISFTANQSFDFTPYWPASNIAKPYTIKVNAQ